MSSSQLFFCYCKQNRNLIVQPFRIIVVIMCVNNTLCMLITQLLITKSAAPVVNSALGCVRNQSFQEKPLSAVFPVFHVTLRSCCFVTSMGMFTWSLYSNIVRLLGINLNTALKHGQTCHLEVPYWVLWGFFLLNRAPCRAVNHVKIRCIFKHSIELNWILFM